jgi:hypothetical protein
LHGLGGKKWRHRGKKWRHRGKNKDRGKKYHIFSPSWNTQLRYCHKKRLCSAGKIWFDFPLAIFSPQYTVCESRKIIAWPKGEKIKTLGEKISYIFPQLDFCALFSVTIKIIGEKIWYYVPYGLHFFPSFP